MKNLVISILGVLSCGIVYALPNGNPTEASLMRCGVWWGAAYYNPCDPCFCWFDVWSLRGGFYGDYVFNRNLKVRNAEFEIDRNIRKTRLNTNAGYLALNVADKIDIFGTIGATNLVFQTNEDAWSLTGEADGTLETDTDFSWSVGVRGTLFQWRCFGVGVEGQYFRTTPKFSYYLSGSNGQFTYFNKDNESTYQEWQVGLGLSYTFSSVCPSTSFVPYVSATCSWVRFDAHNFTFISDGTDFPTLTIFDLKASRLWGFAVGTTLTLYDIVSVTVEGRFVDERAIYVNSQFRF